MNNSYRKIRHFNKMLIAISMLTFGLIKNSVISLGITRRFDPVSNDFAIKKLHLDSLVY